MPDPKADKESSVVKAHKYDAEAKVMSIQFPNGNWHEYKGVTQDVYDSFASAKSLGRHFNVYIRPHYPQSKAA